MLLFITIILISLYYIFLGLMLIVGIPYLFFKLMYIIIVPKEIRNRKKGLKHGMLGITHKKIREITKRKAGIKEK